MSDLKPVRIDRAALDRIIQRAAELQTGEREIGDNLTPEEVLELGGEVGIPARYLQQAMLEHRTAATDAAESRGVLGRVIGPSEVRAQRVVQGEVEDVIRALTAWMDKNELLVVQRQQPGWASWEPLKGMQAAIRRGTASLDTSKPKFMLSRAETVVATATPLETGYSHVTLRATLGDTRRSLLIGAGAASTFGVAGTVTLALVGLGGIVLAAPLVPAALLTAGLLRRFRPVANRVQLGLERALDYLERGGVKPGHEEPSRGPGLLEVIAGEVRRAISSGSQRVDEASRLRPGGRSGPRKTDQR
jgi:hypothetical protein